MGDAPGYDEGVPAQPPRVLLHLASGERRPVDPADVYLLEAARGETKVRTRSRRSLTDVRPLGEPLQRFEAHGFVRIHRSLAVNVGRIRGIRPRDPEGWQVKLEPPVNRVLPVSRDLVAHLWRAFGE